MGHKLSTLATLMDLLGFILQTNLQWIFSIKMLLIIFQFEYLGLKNIAVSVYFIVRCICYLAVHFEKLEIQPGRPLPGERSEAQGHVKLISFFFSRPWHSFAFHLFKSKFLGNFWPELYDFCISTTTSSRSIMFHIFGRKIFFRRVNSEKNSVFGFIEVHVWYPTAS